MNIRPIISKCREAKEAHFCLEIEAWEIESLASHPETLTDEFLDGTTRLRNRENILVLGERFMSSSIDSCSQCIDAYASDNIACPNIDTFNFIKDTLTK